MDSNGEAFNPTHSTHSYFTEWAINRLQQQFPEIGQYADILIEGANSELHELPAKRRTIAYGIDLNQKRVEHQGTNAGSNDMRGWWRDCLAAYQDGNKEQAYFYLGIILHMIQDMGVPAHAWGIEHQGNHKEFDNFELVGLSNWKPKFDEINKEDPGYSEPWLYYNLSQQWTREDTKTKLESILPEELRPVDANLDEVTEYLQETKTPFPFPMTWTFASPEDRQMFMNREGRICALSEWALNAAARAFGQLAGVAGVYRNQEDDRITGFDVADNHMFVATHNSGLQAIDISNLSSPTLEQIRFRSDEAGMVSPYSITGSWIRDVTIQGDSAWLSTLLRLWPNGDERQVTVKLGLADLISKDTASFLSYIKPSIYPSNGYSYRTPGINPGNTGGPPFPNSFWAYYGDYYTSSWKRTVGESHFFLLSPRKVCISRTLLLTKMQEHILLQYHCMISSAEPGIFYPGRARLALQLGHRHPMTAMRPFQLLT
jgi:hypothetical protein